MLWKIKLPMSFTFEVSNGLYDCKEGKPLPLNRQVLEMLGQSIMSSLQKHAKLQLKLPSTKVSAKVDSGITKKGLSSKQFRKSTSKGRTLTLKMIK